MFQPPPALSSMSAPMSGVVVRKDKPPDYNSVLMMKQMEDQELPSYTQAVSGVPEVISDRSESDEDSDNKSKADTDSDQSKSLSLS